MLTNYFAQYGAMTLAVLSGSRALDWYVPGSAENNSDWDLVKEALERSGVRFKTCPNHAIDDLSSKGFTILNKDQILSFVFNYSLVELQRKDLLLIKIIKCIWKMYPSLESESILDYTQWKYQRRTPDITPIIVETNGNVSRWLEDEDIYNLKVIQGYVGEESIGVQLILTPTDQSALSGNALQSVFESIVKFNASHVQCFLINMLLRTCTMISPKRKRVIYGIGIPSMIQRIIRTIVRKEWHSGSRSTLEEDMTLS
jgi:hypothetical protein